MTVITLKQTSLEHLLAELRRITSLVSNRVQEIKAASPEEEDEFRGLYISEEEINQLLSDPHLFQPGIPEANLEASPPGEGIRTSRLQRLQRGFFLIT